ncbi:MAG: DUF3638 domain-containing protein [Simkaniaceae bacterium]|nr:DUF3638 domain-containing protein [Simkaniaceae bacterium]
MSTHNDPPSSEVGSPSHRIATPPMGSHAPFKSVDPSTFMTGNVRENGHTPNDRCRVWNDLTEKRRGETPSTPPEDDEGHRSPMRDDASCVRHPASQTVEKKACHSHPLPDAQSMFALVHGDFMGSTFTPPTREQAIAYVRTFVRNMRRKGGKSGISDESLTTLEDRLSDILLVEDLCCRYSNDYKRFSDEFMQLLRKKKEVAVLSGYSRNKTGHLILILFRMKGGRVSAEVINRGEGSKEATHIDEYGRTRVFAKKSLCPYPANKLEQHPFWRFLLDIRKPEREDGTPADLLIHDFYKVLLPAWPGGTGDFHGKSYKPQYTGTCIFSGIKTIIREWIPEREVRPFLLALSAHVLQEYAKDSEAEGRLSGTATGHLSRRILKCRDTDPERRHALRKEVRHIAERNRTIRPQRAESFPFPSEPIRDESATAHVTFKPPEQTSEDEETARLRDTFMHLNKYERHDIESFPPSRLALWRALAEIPEATDSPAFREKARMLREILAKISPDDPLWTSPRGRALTKVLHDDKQLLLIADAIRIEEQHFLSTRATALKNALLEARLTTGATLTPSNAGYLYRHILTIIPPIDDPVWTTVEGGEVIALLHEMRRSFFQLRDSTDADGVALLFIVDMIRLQHALSLCKNHDNSSDLCDFYVARIQDTFDRPESDLLRPIHPDIAIKFTKAVAYLRSLKRYKEGVSYGDHNNFVRSCTSVYDPEIDSHAPHIAYIRDVMSRDPKAGELFTRWYETAENASYLPISDDAKPGDNAKTAWAWKMFSNHSPFSYEERPSAHLKKEVRQFADLALLDGVWQDCCLLHRGWSKLHREVFRVDGDLCFTERYNGDEDRENSGKHLCLATYPTLSTRGKAHDLRWLLSKRQPLSLHPKIPKSFRDKFAVSNERAGENGHLLNRGGITINGRVLSFGEIKGLFDCTADKELAIDTIINHFNRFPGFLQDPAFREAFLALLTQTHHSRKQIGKGKTRTKTCHLLLRATHNDPEQLLRLIEFAREAGERAETRDLPDQALFLFFIEGLALAYFLRSREKGGVRGVRLYRSFTKRAIRLLHDDTYRDATGSRLLALAPYFHNTSKGEAFSTLTGMIKSFAEPLDDPQERLRVRYGELVAVPHNPKSVEDTDLRMIESPPFAGVYRYKAWAPHYWNEPNSPIALAEDLECYALQTPNSHRYLFFRRGEQEPAYLCEGRGVERLENGKPTGLFLVRDYTSAGARRFAEIALKNDLFLWKDATGEIVLVEYRSSDLLFHRVGNKWMSNKHPGFFPDPDQTCPPFKLATHYLVLRNEGGRRIVYMPDRKLKTPARPPGLFASPTIECERGGSSLFVYRLTDKGEIDPINAHPEELVYAFHLALRAREFTRMAHIIALLKRSPYPLNERSIRFLLDAVDTGMERRDRHPQGVALKIRMLLLALRDPGGLSSKERGALCRILRNEVCDYRMQSGNAFPFALTDEEEATVRRFVGDETAPSVTNTIRGDLWTAFERHWEKLALTPLAKPFSLPHIFRPTPLATRFIDYYRVARHFPEGSPMRKELALLLRGSVYESLPEVRIAAAILEAVSADPNRFVTAEALSEAQEKKGQMLRQIWIQVPAAKKDEKRIRIESPPLIPLHEPDPFLRLPPAQAKGYPRTKRKPADERETPPSLTEGLPGVYATCPDLREEIETVSEIRTTLKTYLDTGTVEPVPDTGINAKTDPEAAKHEPCVTKEIKALIEGAEEMEGLLRRRQGEKVIVIEPEKVAELQKAIALKVERMEGDLKEKEEEILRLARTCPEEQREYVRGEMMTPLSLDKVIVAFGKEDDAYLLRENPFLTEDELNALKGKTEEYLLLHTDRHRLAESLKKLDEGRIGEATLILREKRAYKVRENPRFLVFEHFMGIILREEQIAFLRRLSPGSPGTSSVLEEARTGFGKSKVAIPLWLSLTTSSGELTLLTVPEPLLEETRKQLSRILGDTFDTPLTMIEFSRDNLYDTGTLQSIDYRLKKAQEEGRVVLLPVGTLHALSVLAWKEVLMKEEKGDALPPENVALLLRIRNRLEEASNFIDESSEALRPDFSYNYSSGKKCSVPEEYIEAITTVYEALLSGDLLEEFAPDFSEGAENGRPLDEEVYVREILPTLVDKILDRLNVSPEDRDGAEKSLTGGYDSTCERYFDTLGRKELEYFATIREQLLVHLPASLSLRWNERYVLGEERISFPARYGTRIKRAQFSSIGLVLNCTVQANLKVPFTEEDLELFLEELRNLARGESGDALNYAPGYGMLQQFAGKKQPELNLGREEKEKLLHRINTDPGFRLRFISSFILPKFRYASHILRSYPQLITERTGPTQGASGTLVDTMPGALPLRFDRTAAFHNLIPLWRNSRDRVRTVSHTHGVALMNELLTGQGEEHNVIIDTAGCFRDMCDEEIARAILQETAGRASPIDGVEYMERDTGRRLILRRNAETPVPPELLMMKREKLFTFYSQDAAIGLDIDLAEDSRALVTVGRHTGKNFFLQGVGRLRKLSAGMRASFVVPEEDVKEMKRKLQSDRPDFRFQDLFLYLVRKEGEKQGDNALRVLESEWHAELEQLFRKGTEGLSLELQGELFKRSDTLFLENTFVSPLAGLRKSRKECSAEETVLRKKEELLATLRARTDAHSPLARVYDPDALSERFDEKVKWSGMRSRYPCNSGTGSEVTFAEAETATSSGFEEQESTDDRVDHAKRDTLLFTPAIPIKFPTSTLPYTAMTSYKPLETYVAEGGLFRSPNFFHIASYREDIHKEVMKDAQFVLLARTRANNKYEMILLDLHDAGHIKEDMREKRTPRDGERDFYLCTADNMKIIARNGEPLEKEPMAVDDIRRLMIDGRFYTSHPTYDDRDFAIIRERYPHPDAFFDILANRFVPPFPHLAPHIDRLRKRTARLTRR